MGSFKFKLKELDKVDSTNNYIRALDFKLTPNGYCVLADYQDFGKGQRGKVWKSDSGLNLTFSFFLKTDSIPPSNQFTLLQLVSLSVCHTIGKLTDLKPSIKWPNDIMIGKKKMAGILIENFIQSGHLNSIIGIGLNVNQTTFESFSPEATSLKALTGDYFNLKLILSLFEHEFIKLYEKLGSNESQLESEYRNKLYAQGQIHDFETANGEYLVAEVIGVDRFGRLILNVDGHPKAFLNGEIRWLF